MPATAKVNIQGIVETWAYDRFHNSANRTELKLLKKELIDVEIDWKRVQFIHDDPIYDPEVKSVQEKIHAMPISNLLFSTEYSNRTDALQSYSFQAQRTTKSSCSVVIEQCYTFGQEMNVKLTTPNNILELNVGFKREMALTNSETETFEEEMTWGVNSQIDVKAGNKALAKLIVMEEKYDGTFNITTRISGRIRVVFRNIKDDRSFIRAAEADIVEIIRKVGPRFGTGSSVVVDETTTKTVLCRTKGTCKFKYGIKQIVEVDQVPLNS